MKLKDILIKLDKVTASKVKQIIAGNPNEAKKVAKQFLDKHKIKFSKMSAKSKYHSFTGEPVIIVTVEGIPSAKDNPFFVLITNKLINELRAEMKKVGALVVLYSDSGFSL